MTASLKMMHAEQHGKAEDAKTYMDTVGALDRAISALEWRMKC